jgi:hypothetical protein
MIIFFVKVNHYHEKIYINNDNRSSKIGQLIFLVYYY